MAQVWNLPFQKVLGHSYIARRYPLLLMGHNWLNCFDMRGSCGILGDVMHHQRLLKCPVIHSITSFIVKVLASRQGEAPGCSHLNLSLYNPWNLGGFCVFLYPWWIKTVTIPLINRHENCKIKPCCGIPCVVTIYLSTLSPSLSISFYLFLPYIYYWIKISTIVFGMWSCLHFNFRQRHL